MDLREHEEEQLKEDLALLKRLEDNQRYENDEKSLGKLNKEIEILRQRIVVRQNRLEALQDQNDSEQVLGTDDLIICANFFALSPEKVELAKQALESSPAIYNSQKAFDCLGKRRPLSFKEKIESLAEQSHLIYQTCLTLWLKWYREIQIDTPSNKEVTYIWLISLTYYFIFGRTTEISVQQFFSRESLERGTFVSICCSLTLEWQEVIDTDFLKILVNKVQPTRQKRYDKIQDQCGTLRILDIAKPVGINDLYVDVNILDELPSNQHLDVADLPKIHNPKNDEFDRFSLGKVRQQRILGLEAVLRHSKLMVLGKPGSGKSTFLQHIAIQCNQGLFQASRVPVFIRLKNFADDLRNLRTSTSKASNNLLFKYICQEFRDCYISDHHIVESLLTHGRTLILLDGLDEVQEEIGNVVVREIDQFCQKFYKNQFIITCRIAAKEYKFQGFIDVEVADFNQEQIEIFAKNWFMTIDKNSEELGRTKADQFISRLALPENQQIRELAVTPILLNLACLVFQAQASFPPNRTRLYEEALDILLKRWDEARGIRRDEVYRDLLLANKIALLTRIAAYTFEQSRYFLKEEEIEKVIEDYLITLRNTSSKRRRLGEDSQIVLKAIEAQHGLLVERARRIYSFSHLTFQEYFTAKDFVTKFSMGVTDGSVSYATSKKWREVFLLAVNMMRNGDELLRQMKQEVDILVAQSDKIQNFLSWVYQESISLEVPYRSLAVRAYYFDQAYYYYFHNKISALVSRSFNCNHDPKIDHDIEFVNLLNPELNLVVAICMEWLLNRAFGLDWAVKLHHQQKIDFDIVRNLAEIFVQDLDFSFDIVRLLEPSLESILQEVRGEMPDVEENFEGFQNYWLPSPSKGWSWAHKLAGSISRLERKDVVINWDFDEGEKKLLKQYYDSTGLLVECLNSGCEVTSDARYEIEDSLLLPLAEIQAKRF